MKMINSLKVDKIEFDGLELIAATSVNHLDPKSQQNLIEGYLRFNKKAVIKDGKLYAGGISIEAHNLDTGLKERIDCEGSVAIPNLGLIASDIARHEEVEDYAMIKFIDDPAVVIPRKDKGYIIITYSMDSKEHHPVVKDVYTTSQLDGNQLIKKTTGYGRFTKGTGLFEKHFPSHTSDIENFVSLSYPMS